MNTLAGTMYAFFHPDTDVKPQTPRGGHLSVFQETKFYVDYHSRYMKLDDYPFGLLDVLGYRAETKLFGGVLLFDRGDSGTEVCQRYL